MTTLYRDATQTVEKRVSSLLACMNLEEKIGQLLQDGGWLAYEKRATGIEVSAAFREKLSGGGIGALWGLLRADWWTGRGLETGLRPSDMAEAANAIQRFAVGNTRWGIPLLLAEECAHGLMALGATVYPTGLGLASTWSPALIRQVGEMVAREASSAGIHIAYGPVLDLARDPRWSRVEETFGEDPLLVARLGVAMVQGLQGDQFESGTGKVLSTLKHFAAHGEPEGGHNSAATHVGGYDLHNFHYLPFRECVRAGALSLMASYNQIDGTPCSGNHSLLTTLLRENWGFKGFIVSDAGSVEQLCTVHRVASDPGAASAMALRAGVDLELFGTAFKNGLRCAMERGLIEMGDLDQAVGRILEWKFRLGLFENPYVASGPAAEIFGCQSHRDLALETARKSLILLSNRAKALPLAEVQSLAVVGPNADTPMNQLGDYTAPQERSAVVTVLDGIRARAGAKVKIHYAKGCKVRSLERSGFAEAISAAQSCDAVVLVLGGSSAPDAETGFLENGAARIEEVRESSDFDKDSGEGYDRAKLGLAGLQLELLRELKATGKPVIVVLIQGRPLILKEVLELADAVLLAWYPGMEGGRAVAEALFGDLNPGGKLPVSLPSDVGQLPVYYNSASKRDNYVDCSAAPLLPFGYGLSYTQFSFSDLRVEPAAIPADGKTVVSITVKNEGALRGDEVIQLYVKDAFASLARPLKELKEFKRISLNPGESQRVEFRLNVQALGFWTPQGDFVVEPGEFEIGVGGNPLELMTAPLHLLL